MKTNRKKITTALMAGMLALSLLVSGCGSAGKDTGAKGEEAAATWDNPLPDPRPKSDFVPQVPNVSEEFKKMKGANSDIVGWLQVPGTSINEAVVQGSDNDYYIRRDALKNYAFSGSYFLDYENTVGDGTAGQLSQNMIIYGHNLGAPQGVKDDPDGVKFAQLLKFDNIDFAREHPYFYFTTSAGTHIYEIFTVFYSEDVLTPVPYHFPLFTETEYKGLISDVRNRSQFDYNVEIGPEDKLMTLSTCSYKYGTYTQNPRQRFVVMGKLMVDGEEYYDKADMQENPDPKEPQF